MKMLCDVYKSPRKSEMYIFVRREDALNRVPEKLLNEFGEPQLVTSIELSPQRKLARALASEVLQKLEEQGFYLQLPPSSWGHNAGNSDSLENEAHDH